MPQPPTTRMAILALLKQEGNMPAAEIAERLAMNRKAIDASILIAHERKLMHIAGWNRNLGTGGRLSPIWAPGPGEDKKQPRIHKYDNRRRYAEKMREVIRLKTQARRGRPVNPWIALLGK